MVAKLTYVEPNGEVCIEKYVVLDYSSFETLKHFILELPKLPGRIKVEEVLEDVR